MSKLSDSAVKVIEELEKKFSLDYIVKQALQDKEYSELLSLTIRYGVA